MHKPTRGTAPQVDCYTSDVSGFVCVARSDTRGKSPHYLGGRARPGESSEDQRSGPMDTHAPQKTAASPSRPVSVDVEPRALAARQSHVVGPTAAGSGQETKRSPRARSDPKRGNEDRLSDRATARGARNPSVEQRKHAALVDMSHAQRFERALRDSAVGALDRASEEMPATYYGARAPQTPQAWPGLFCRGRQPGGAHHSSG